MLRTVAELSDPYANFMINPAPAGNGVCGICRTLIDPAYSQCYSCNALPNWFSAIVPITYSLDLGQMHTALRGYKDGWGGDSREELRNRFTAQLAAVLWRFLDAHEPCIANAAGIAGFDMVTTVPSGTPTRDNERWRLRWIAGEGCGATARRYRRVLAPTELAAAAKTYHPDRYVTTEELDGQAVLLVDDTWTQGGSAQSAGAALARGGAATLGIVVLGRHIDPSWRIIQGEASTNGDRLKAARPWSWDICAVHPR